MSCEPLVYIENNTTTGLMETSSSDTASENSPTTTSVTTNNLQISSDSFDIELNITTIDDGSIIDQSNCPSRRVSFPKCDSKLVTGYLEPANPWESALIVKNVSELTDIYTTSCQKHNTQPLENIINHLQTLDLTKKSRHSCFSLKNHLLSPNDCETLEDIFKRIRYDVLDFSSCHLNEISSSALFDIIEYYEAATELDISDNPAISIRGWQSCSIMIRRSHYLQILTARGNPMSEINATSLGNALTFSSSLHTIKLERCGLKGKPISNLCNGLKKNSTLKELWLACNDLNEKDAENLAELLKYNGYIQFLDISNNNIKDAGLKHIVVALMEQSFNLDLFLPDDNKKIEEDINIKSSAATNYPTNIQIPSPDEDYSNYLDNNSISQNNKSNINGSNNSNCGGRSMLDTLLNNQQKSESDDSSNDTITQNTVLSSSFVINNSINSSVITGFSKNKTNNFIYSTEKLINKQQEQLNLKKETEISNFENIYTNTNDDDTTTTTISAHSLSKAVDVNKNKNNTTTATDIFNPHSVDSAFESSSEGDKKSLLINPEVITTNLIKSSTELEENIVTTATAITTTTTNTTKKLISPVQLSRLAYEKLTQFNEKTNDSDIITTTISNDHLRSHSSDSLSSENSLDGCEATFSKDLRAQLAKNDTLTRQKTNIEQDISGNIKPRGLRALILWNNYITRESSEIISELLQTTSSLELLNIGKNCLSNEFIHKIKDKLKMNSTLTNLGLQAAHLSCDGVKSLASVLQFGGNCTLQRIDIRENHIQVDCLNILMDALKSNKSVTRIDIDDVPKRISDPGSDLQFHYSRALHNIRSLCSRNEKNQHQILLDSLAANNKKCENPKLRQGYFNSRKISLTCQSITNPTNILETNQRTTSGSTTTGSNNKLDIKRKSGIRLRSPLPSPPTISPSTSPVPSPSKSRFQVFRVNEDNSFFPTTTANNKNINKNYPTAMVQTTKKPLITATAAATRKSRFRVTKVENDQQTSLNYHSLDAANSINVKEISLKDDIAQNLLKSKSLPDFITTPTNLYVKNNENNEQKHQNIINNDNNDNCNINIKSQIIINDDNINNDMINFIGNLNSNNIIENSANLGEPIKIVSTINENNLSNNLVGDSSFNDKDINKQQQQQNQQLINNECDQCLENIVDNNKIINQNDKNSICSPKTNIDMHKNNNDKINENLSNKSEETSNKLEQEFQQQQQQNGKTSTVSSTYPTTVDKLLSLFQNPGDIFSRVTNTTDSTTTESTATAILEQSNQQSLVPLRKHSPPNLFSWYKFKGDTKTSPDIVTTIPPVITLTHQHQQQQLISMDSIIPQQHQQQQTTSTITDNTVSNNKQTSFFDVASKQFKDFADFGKQIFKQNVNFVKAANCNNSTSSATTTTTTIAAIQEPPINPPYFSTASCSVDPITTKTTTTTTVAAVVVTATTEIPDNSTATIATNNLDIVNNIKSNTNSNKENINEYMNKSDSEYCTTLKSSSSSSSLSLKSLQLICDFQNESMSNTNTTSTNLINDKLLLPTKITTKSEHTINLNEKYIIIEKTPILVATNNVSPEIDIVVCSNNNVVMSSDSIVAVAAATKNDKFNSVSITDNSSSDCVVTTTTASAAAQNLKYEQQNFEFSDVNSSNGGGDGVVGSVSNINELILHQI